MPAIVENRRRSWMSLSIVWILMAILAGIGLGRALDSLSPLDRKLHIACDRVVERLLTTHEPVELERSRILVNALHCGVSRRVGDWPAGRTGGLVPLASWLNRGQESIAGARVDVIARSYIGRTMKGA